MNIDLSGPNIAELAIAILFFIALAIQLFNILYFNLRVVLFKSGSDPSATIGPSVSNVPVSIIITAKNQSAELLSNLPHFFDQDYTDYEVVVVVYESDDNSDALLQSLAGKYKNLKYTVVNKDLKFNRARKLAITLGVKSAKYEWLLFTDADCRPGSPLWLVEMAKNFTPKAQVVIGYGRLQKQNGIIDKLARLDNLNMAIRYFSLAIAGLPTIAVSKNMAYRRSLFFNNKGFASLLNSGIGEDDIFVNRLSGSGNTKIVMSHLAHTLSPNISGFSGWINRRDRYISGSFHYKPQTRFIIGAELLSRLLLYVLFIIIIATGNYFLYAALAGFFVRLILNLGIFNVLMKRLNEKSLLLFAVIYDIIILPFDCISLIVQFVNEIRRV